MDWLGDWANRMKITIDSNKIDEDLSYFPVAITLASGTGILNQDVSYIFDELGSSVNTVFSDDFSGTFSDNWVNNSNGNSAADFYNNKLRLDLNGGSSNEGANALSKDSWTCTGKYIIEFDWEPVAGTGWYDDDGSDAENAVEIVNESPTYSSSSWHYYRCEITGTSNSKLYLRLRSTKSGAITISNRISGSTYTVLNESFSYGSSHSVRWEIDFDEYTTTLYMDGAVVGSTSSWDSSVLNYIGNNFKLNFHWHTYLHSADQLYDNLTIKKVLSNNKKIAVTQADGITQQYVEIESWDAENKKATLWTGVSGISSSTDTDLYLYYDNNQADNYKYVGDTGEIVAQRVWDDDFVGVWHMAQDPSAGSGAIKDSTSNNNNGTSVGSMTTGDLVDAITGKGIAFSGSNQGINCGDQADFDSYTITVEVVGRLDNSTTNVTNYAISQYGANTLNYWNIDYRTDVDGIRIYEGKSGNAVKSSIDPKDAWYNSVIVINQPSSYYELFVNSVSQGTNSTGWPGSSDADLYIGYSDYQGDTTRSFQGVICEARYSIVKRSDAWIKATYYSNFDNLLTFDTSVTPSFGYSGYVQVAGSPARRRVGLYNRSTMELVAEGYSDPSTGYFILYTPYNGYHFSIILPELGDSYNLIASDKIHPEN